MNFIPATLIRIKRDGGELTADQWHDWIAAYTSGDVSDAQMAALAMAVCCRGMSDAETTALTTAMLVSGDRLQRLPGRDRPRVDKHSTGGLGDKVSLILAPLLAVCGADVPMISGRGLGRTGGTLDKLEAIPGFQTKLSPARTEAILRDVGCFIISADDSLVPADRRLYALRDVTATVESVGLITASILSKKLAESLDALVMDVKVGSAAFMPDLASARRLADSIVRVGAAAGLPTTAHLTDMDQPLGWAIGNGLEVNEAIAVLRGGGPADVRELTIHLAADLITRVGLADSIADARRQASVGLDQGSAMECFSKMVAAQGGRLEGALPVATEHVHTADQAGWVQSIDCPRIGDAIIAMGGGRRRAGDPIDPRVGVSVHVKIGDRIDPGQLLWTVHGDSTVSLAGCVKVSDQPVSPGNLIHDPEDRGGVNEVD